MGLSGALPNIRGMYKAADGNRLIHADYSQQEIRMLRIIAKDDVLGEAITIGDKGGGNVYCTDAKILFGLPQDMDVKAVKKSAYKLAKEVHLAFQYGAGLPTVYARCLREDRRLTYKSVKETFYKMRQRYHRTVAYWDEEMARVKSQGYSEARILGHRRYYPVQPPITEVANYPAQATAAELSMIAMLAIRKQLKTFKRFAKLIAFTHDSFDVEASEDAEPEVKEMMKTEMERPVYIEGCMYVFPVDIKSGFLWSEV